MQYPGLAAPLNLAAAEHFHPQMHPKVPARQQAEAPTSIGKQGAPPRQLVLPESPSPDQQEDSDKSTHAGMQGCREGGRGPKC